MLRLARDLAVFLLFTGFLAAQTKGTISGYTKDPSGAFVPNVQVNLTNEGTGAKRTTTSDETGFYQVLGLVSGTYTIDAEVSGFKRYRNTGVVLTVDQNVRADVELQIGQVSDSVEVAAQAVLIDTRSSEHSATIDDRRIVDLPLSGRNVFALAATLPGVLGVSAPDNSALTDARSGPIMNVNGARDNMNYDRFNGTYFMNPSRNTGLNVPPPDAIQEFRIQTSNFAADSGRNPGANITIVSKQGTNAIHGAAWEFVRNDHLNARTFFQAVKPVVKKNQFGAAAGGPIKKDKVFIFGTFELAKDHSQSTSTNALPPATPELNGDFSSLKTKQLVNPFDNTTFPNNQLPRSLFDPVAVKLLGFVPTVPQPGVTIQALGGNPRDAKLFMVRGDATLTSKQTLFGHYYFNQNKNVQDGLAYSANIAGWTGRNLGPRIQNIGLNHVYTITPTLLNQVTLGFARSFSLDLPTVSRTPAELGIQGMPQYSEGGSPQFTVTGRFTLGSGGTVKFISNNYQLLENLTIIRNRHTIKVGIEALDLSFFQSFLGPPNFSFNGVRTGGGTATKGDPMADFLIGAYQQLPISNGVRVNDDLTKFVGMFFQDDFKVSPRLTLNMGLRWELPQPWVSRHDQLNSIRLDPTIHSKVLSNAPPGLLFPGDLPRGLFAPNRKNFAPRFGFAYDVFGDGRTAIRGAYGIFFETNNADTLAQTNPPFNGGSRTFFNGLLSNPFGSIGVAAPPAFVDPAAVTFSFPLNGLWGPITDKLKTTSVQEWDLILQRELRRDFALSVGYIGKTGRHLLAFRPFNAAPYIPGVDASGNPRSTVSNANQRVPFLSGIYGPSGAYLDNPFTSSYHSLQASLSKRFSKGLQFSAAYTLAKSIDSSSTDNLGGCLLDPFNVRHDRGLSSWDRRHAFVFSGVWTPPVYQRQEGLFGRMLGGWSLSGIETVQTGTPLTVSSGQDTMLNGSGCNGTADLLSDPNRAHSSRNDEINAYFNTAAFGQPLPGSPGTSGRGIFVGPRVINTDLAVLKDIAVREQLRFQFRAEFFNLLNEVNFSNPVVSLTSGTFGKIQGTGASRTIQFGLKLLW